jgi:hypothetical protein
MLKFITDLLKSRRDKAIESLKSTVKALVDDESISTSTKVKAAQYWANAKFGFYNSEEIESMTELLKTMGGSK